MINTYGPPPMAHRIRIDRAYTPSFATDIRETFERQRRRLQREERERALQAMRACPNDERFIDAA